MALTDADRLQMTALALRRIAMWKSLNYQLLLDMEGENGSTTILDKVSGDAMTIYANAKLSTDAAKFGSSSMYLDGLNSYISVPGSGASLYFGDEDFTIDCWINLVGLTSVSRMCIYAQADAEHYKYIVYEILNNRIGLSIYEGSNIVGWFSTPLTWNNGQWYHLATIRNGSDLALYVDGVRLTIDTGYFYHAWTNSTIPLFNTDFMIGCWVGNTRDFKGYIDYFRVVIGMALWTENFTPPTVPSNITRPLISTDGLPLTLAWLIKK